MKLGSLFTGYGGLDMAVEQVFGARTVWTSDIDPGACKIIAHRMPDAPNLGDITKIDWATVDGIDLLDAGWPCQPFSHAGKRLGAADERALWPYVAGAVRALRPRHVVLENVAAIASVGELARAVADLAAVGYVGSWRCLRAADVGAPHGRARIFIWATASYSRRNTDGRQQERHRQYADHRPFGGPWESGDGAVANPTGDGRQQGWPEPARLVGGPDAAQRGRAPADTLSGGCNRRAPEPLGGPRNGTAAAGRSEVDWGPYEPAIRRWERVLGRPAPAPTEPSRNGGQRLSPAFVEWMQGLDPGHVTDVPGLGRNAQLKALGNGVVPQQAVAALRLMLDQLTAAA